MAYSRFVQNNIASINLDIGRRLLEQLSIEDINNNLFKIVDCMNLGIELIKDPSEKYMLATLNERAALISKDIASFTLAEKLFETALSLLDGKYRKEKFDIYYELYQCKIINGKLAGATPLFNTE